MTKEKIVDLSKLGAGAILSAWLGVTNLRVSKLEDQLYRCLQGKEISIAKSNEQPTIKMLAVLPKEIRIKNERYAK